MIVRIPKRFTVIESGPIEPPHHEDVRIEYDPDAAERLYQLTKRWKLENVDVEFVVCGPRAFFSLLAAREWKTNRDAIVFVAGTGVTEFEISVPGWTVRLLLGVELADDAMVIAASTDAMRMRSVR